MPSDATTSANHRVTYTAEECATAVSRTWQRIANERVQLGFWLFWLRAADPTYTFRRIAEELGVPKSTASDYLRRYETTMRDVHRTWEDGQECPR